MCPSTGRNGKHRPDLGHEVGEVGLGSRRQGIPSPRPEAGRPRRFGVLDHELVEGRWRPATPEGSIRVALEESVGVDGVKCVEVREIATRSPGEGGECGRGDAIDFGPLDGLAGDEVHADERAGQVTVGVDGPVDRRDRNRGVCLENPEHAGLQIDPVALLVGTRLDDGSTGSGRCGHADDVDREIAAGRSGGLTEGPRGVDTLYHLPECRSGDAVVG
jgi:hypothetical protein